MSERALFGPAGNGDAFSKQYKSSAHAPEYLAGLGLDVYEYQCGRGVNIGKTAAAAIGDAAKRHGITVSLHAPYFISLSSPDPERIQKNLEYILASCEAAANMGGDRVVVHCGGLMGLSREEALANTIRTLSLALAQMEEKGLSAVTLCVETMGKRNMLGDLTEVLAICKSDERLLPCVDFGHLNCRMQGGLNGRSAYTLLLDELENTLGFDRAKHFHSHFSHIEYSAGGEVRHLTLEDTVFGPEFKPLAEVLVRRGYAPRIICESAGTQDIDAALLKDTYTKLL